MRVILGQHGPGQPALDDATSREDLTDEYTQSMVQADRRDLE